MRPGAIHNTRSDGLVVEHALPLGTQDVASFDHTDSPPVVVLYGRGTLAGEWLDSESFKGIRFIDRFEIAAATTSRSSGLKHNAVADNYMQSGEPPICRATG